MRAPIGETLLDHEETEKKEFYTVVGSLSAADAERTPGVETTVLVRRRAGANFAALRPALY